MKEHERNERKRKKTKENERKRKKTKENERKRKKTKENERKRKKIAASWSIWVQGLGLCFSYSCTSCRQG